MWAAIGSFILALFSATAAAEDYLRYLRDLTHRHGASGEIVIVAFDDKSLDKLGRWPLPRDYFAQITDRLSEYGASRTFFDFDLSSATDPASDRKFAGALAHSNSDIVLATRFVIDPFTSNRTDLLPRNEFRKRAELASINVRYNYRTGVTEIPFALSYEGRVYPSFAAKLANKGGEEGAMFPIDFSIDPRSVPLISAVDLIEGKIDASFIAGKDIVVAPTSFQFNDNYMALGYGLLPGVYFQVLGAETLKTGDPIGVGWFLPLLLAILFGSACLRLRNVRLHVAMALTAAAAFLLLPLWLERQLIFVEVVPAAFFLGATGLCLSWARLRRSSRVNPVSGLSNLTEIRNVPESDSFLVAGRIQNYAELAAAIPSGSEKQLIEQIVKRFKLGAAGSDLYHGDEGVFAFFLSVAWNENPEDQLNGLHALFRNPVLVAGKQLDLTVTFGVDEEKNRSPENRLGAALLAADEALSEGRKWKKHDSEKLKDADWRLSILSQLDSALERGDLWVAYQPKLDLRTREIVGAEALVRWTHPVKGAINPIDFVLAAEQSGRIETLTYYVLDAAIAAAATIHRHDYSFTMAVNLSARLVDDPALPSTVEKLLSRHGLPAQCLTLEVTETAAMASGQGDFSRLQALLDLGVELSIDDYGTGLSTLEYLKKIPAAEIKIDRMFVLSLLGSRSDQVMVRSTIELAHSLGRKVVAEGVEDEATLELLAEMGCDVAQGYLIGRPTTFRMLSRQLIEHRRRLVAES